MREFPVDLKRAFVASGKSMEGADLGELIRFAAVLPSEV